MIYWIKWQTREGTNGGAKIQIGDEVWFGVYNKEVILFP